jgi:cell division protein FtsZ
LDSPPLRPVARYVEARAAKPIAEHARHAAPQSLDPYGRRAPVGHAIEERILDIPVFLRRRVK